MNEFTLDELRHLKRLNNLFITYKHHSTDAHNKLNTLQSKINSLISKFS